MQVATVDHRLPRYQQLRDSFAGAIARGEWTPGTAIPGEDDLAATHGVAVGTVRKALETLVAEGRLERRQGKGTYVRRPDFGNALARFFRVTDAMGELLRPESRVLARETRIATPEIAERLALAPGAAVLWLSRLRLVDDKPLLAEDIWLPHARFEPLATLPIDAFGPLLYPLYERLCGQVVASARETLRVGVASADIAARLDVAPGASVVAIDRVARGHDEAILEFRRSYGPSERFSYSVDIR
jgi:GntR family transcriptional regulator